MRTSAYQSEIWADVVPIPQNEGGPNPLAAIAYTEEYSEASDYLRAVMAADEKSHRALDLTEHLISMNPAHYTVWVYRASILSALKVSPLQELAFLTSISLEHLKNYQIWHHRQVIVSQLDVLPETEPEFLATVLARDVKNYHVWSYRQWLVGHFDLFADCDADATAPQHPGGNSGELVYVEKLLGEDVRNNSAWHHRFFVVFEKPGRNAANIPETVVQREIEFAKAKVRIAPQNQSAWNYLQGVLRKTGRDCNGAADSHVAGGQSGVSNPDDELRRFAEEYADLERPDEIRSSHALDFLAKVWAQEREKEKAELALDLLAERFDPIRKKYWMWRKSKLQPVAAPA